MYKFILSLLLGSTLALAQGKANTHNFAPKKAQISFGQLIPSCDGGEKNGKFDSTFYFTDENELVFWEVEKYWIRVRPSAYDREFNRQFVNGINWDKDINIYIYLRYKNKIIQIQPIDKKQVNDSLYLAINPQEIRQIANNKFKSFTEVVIEVLIKGKLQEQKKLRLLTEWD